MDKRMKSRIVWSVVALLVYLPMTSLYGMFRPSIEASIAVAQVKNSVITYSLVQQVVQGNLVPNVLGLMFLLALVLIWGGYIVQKLKPNGSSAVIGFFVFTLAFLTSACGPPHVQPLENVGTNETAFVIPIEGDTAGQAKFESVDFLKEHKVLAKRIVLPVRERSTGRMWWDYEYLPTVRVIKVDRQLITREWTKSGSTGTSNKDEALSVASRDSINFHVGVNLTAFITEEDAPTYLYWHGQKSLPEVVDTNVRGYLQGIMADEFGKLKLEECKEQKAAIFKKANDETIEKFKKVGITISYVGSAQGFSYDDEGIQKKINETQTAEMAVQVASKNALEQVEINKKVVSQAIANRQAAEEFAKAKEAQQAKIALDIQMVQAKAMETAAGRWDGKMPTSIMPQGTNLLFGLDKQKEGR